MKTRNAPVSIIVTGLLIGLGALFNFAIGLVFSLAPENFKAISVPITPSGSPPPLLIIAGISCIAFGFVYLWVIKEFFNKSHIAIVLIYTIASINILFGLFRWPLGLLLISFNLLVVFLVRSKSAKKWYNTVA